MAKAETGTSGIGSDGSASDGVVDDGIAVIDPTAIGSGSDNGSGTSEPAPKPKRRSPTKRATSRSKTKAKNPNSVIGIEKILLSMHMMAASAFKIEELALDETEAKALSEGVKEVASHYDIEPDPKIMAWVGLIGTCSAIYAPRIMAYKMRKSTERKEERERHKPQQVESTQHDPTEPFIEPLPLSAVS